jgi:ABC-type multidrug transport system fused ATPase/permease subunit
MEGLILSGGFGVDVNVFLDFAIATAIGIGLLQNATLRAVGNQPGRWQTAVSLAVWIAVALTPFVLASQQGFQKTKEIFNTLTNNPQRADVAYIKTKPGPAICENPALCYWAGKDFGVDVNNLKILTFGQPQVEKELIAQLTSCFYAVIQVSTDDWDDDEDGRFTAAIIGILKKDYTIAWKNGETQYFVPSHCTTISRQPRDPNVSR